MPTYFATNFDVTKSLGRKDTLRMIKGDGNSPFIRMSVHTDRNNEGMVLVRRPDVITGKPVLQWVSPYATTPDDSLVLKVETIVYTRNSKMGATALDEVSLWYESVDTAYVAVRRENGIGVTDAEGNPTSPRETVVDTFMRYDSTNKNWVTGSIVPLRFAESNEDLTCWSDAFLTRLNSNIAALDHRTKEWTQKSIDANGVKTQKEIVTSYGMFLLQKERDSNARKGISKSA